MQFLVRKDSMSGVLAWFLTPQAGRFGQLPHLIPGQAKQFCRPAFVNAPFSKRLVHLSSALNS
jgi:hypothetical protein